MLLLANSARDADGMRVLHRKMTANYRKWAAHMKVPPQCAGDSDIAQNKVRCPAGTASGVRHKAPVQPFPPPVQHLTCCKSPRCLPLGDRFGIVDAHLG